MRTNITLEQALQKASRRLRDKMFYSVNLLKNAENLALAYGGDSGYYLAFSAGKDSQALYHIAELAGVKFEAHMNLTSVDPPEVIRFVKQAYPEVDLIKPKKSIYQHAIEKQILPTMRVRWCCAEYKENAGAGRVTLIGIRHQESSRRAKRNEVEISNRKFSGTLEGLDEYRQELKAKRARRKSKKDGVNITNADQEQTLGCISGKESILISPIIHWTEKDVWEFLNNVMEVPHCSLYDEGWHRLGCIGCPMSSAKQKQIENVRYPHVKRNWIKAIKAIRGGQNSFQATFGGTSKRIGCQSETSEDYSGHRRLDCPSRPQTLARKQFYGGGRWAAPTKLLPKGHLDGRRNRTDTEQEELSGVRVQGELSTADGCRQPKIGSYLHEYKGEQTHASEYQGNGCRTAKIFGGGLQDKSQREDLIAENIYDWWISGKSYKKWYADKFLQLKFEFEE